MSLRNSGGGTLVSPRNLDLGTTLVMYRYQVGLDIWIGSVPSSISKLSATSGETGIKHRVISATAGCLWWYVPNSCVLVNII